VGQHHLLGRRRQSAETTPVNEVTLFRNCAKRELRELARITSAVSVPAGRVLCQEGRVERQCFVVVEGEATATIAGEQVATFGPGGLFGDLALIDRGPQPLTVTAETDMRLLVLSMSEFDELVEKVPTVTKRIVAGLAARVSAGEVENPRSRWSSATIVGHPRQTFSLIGLDPFEGFVDASETLMVDLDGAPPCRNR
jgi:signal-transduction protein with cAMP-binding, CBS, and nucleotidyltransferase domain